MVRALPTRDKAFLGRGDEEVDRVSDGLGDSFRNYTIIGVVYGDRASGIDGGG